jgi:glycosyltransferase involved in cell wall biosynthesis
MAELSIICPVYNEKDFIGDLANTFLKDDGIDKEILFVDGGSTDGSVEIIKSLAVQNSGIKLIENPAKYVNLGFNIAFEQSNGKYIAFLGAHSEYPENYFKLGLDVLKSNEADAVGGPLKQMGKTIFGKAIALCLSSRFGVGDTEFRVYKKKMYVDSVAFAVYKRKIFDNIGLLDKDLIKNQDDEFHYRMNAAGYKILMVPEMESTYYVRDTLGGVIKQYFNYGLYKPLVLRKIGQIVSLRHFIPAVFVVYLLSLPVFLWNILWLVPLAVYLLLDIYFSLSASGNYKIKLISFVVFPALHISYGIGFLLGLFKLQKK